MIVYDTETLNCKTVALTLSLDAEFIEDIDLKEKAMLITYTSGRGKASKSTLKFLKKYHHLIVGVVVSGEARYKSWAWRAAEIITKKYPHIKLVLKIEKQGTDQDLLTIKAWYEQTIGAL